MFDIGISHLVVIAITGIIVLGPEKLPGFARDAARMIRTAKELLGDAQAQLQEELGEDYARLDPRNLDPRAAIRQALADPDQTPSDGHDTGTVELDDDEQDDDTRRPDHHPGRRADHRVGRLA